MLAERAPRVWVGVHDVAQGSGRRGHCPGRGAKTTKKAIAASDDTTRHGTTQASGTTANVAKRPAVATRQLERGYPDRWDAETASALASACLAAATASTALRDPREDPQYET
jgi:hypothetical protein